MAENHPKRLIEVDLPIRQISAQARREKSQHHGHISSLHQWWARRPPAACRAVLLATLLPDPADPACPSRFREDAASRLRWLRDQRGGAPKDWANPLSLREALLEFIALFSDWDQRADPALLKTARGLVASAHESLSGQTTPRPLVVDPFAGGGAIPFEALRVGADAYSSDINPVAVLLNKIILEYVPKFGMRLADEVERWGAEISAAARKRLSTYYPGQPVAYLWARTARCEGPGCGATVPMIRSLQLAKRRDRAVALQLLPELGSRTISVGIIEGSPGQSVGKGTVKRGSLVCPLCGFTTAADRVRSQFQGTRGGARHARLLAVVTDRPGRGGRDYRLPNGQDEEGVRLGAEQLQREQERTPGPLSLVPDEPLPYLRSIFNIRLLDTQTWGDLFTPRQALALTTLGKEVVAIHERAQRELGDPALAAAVSTVLALVPNKCADYWSSLCGWIPEGEKIGHTFGRQALGIIWDFAEANPFADISGAFDRCLGHVVETVRSLAQANLPAGHAESASATAHPLADDSAHVVFTDPPYYDAVPYADLSDFFYVWFRRNLASVQPALFSEPLSPKEGEIVQLAERSKQYAYKTKERFELLMKGALIEARRIVVPNGVAVIVFAHKTTSAWETMLQAVLQAGWRITASWPLDTEKPGRLRAQRSAALASSVHLVCRPREDGEVGDWRKVLVELPARIKEWMPRLAAEGVVGADAIFACLGPALEVFSRYERVEKVSGERVELPEYLEHVWAAVSREALTTIFEGADTAGLEADARITAIWLWTLASASANGSASAGEEADEDQSAVTYDESTDGSASNVFALDFDTARKIAQGLGASLEALRHVIEIEQDSARLRSVAERTAHLFGRDDRGPGVKAPRKKQMGLFEELDIAAESQGWSDGGTPTAGVTTLDRVHQAMLLFASSRGEALKRFLVAEGVGRQPNFWKLAQSLSALYPSGSDEKRWVDGVLSRKKGLGFG